MGAEKLLMHFCCGPCGVGCMEKLREVGQEFTGLWYNPNMHPFTEYRARREALRELSTLEGFHILWRDEYGLRPFVKAVAEDIEHRCAYCYKVRMEGAAQAAKENGFDAFTTTLLVSPYQNHEGIVSAAEAAADKFGVKFMYFDFRPYFREGQAKAREIGLYMQKFCGCIFSEEERYSKAFRKKKSEK